MENKVGSLVSLAVLALLAACECGKKPKKAVSSPPQVAVVEDNSFVGSAADFIANAGDRVYFAYDKSNLSKEAEITLDRQVAWLKHHETKKILVEGHCDERGTREYNLGLGERRTDAVAKHFLANGISGQRVRTISYGKDRPVAALGSTEEIHQLNRVAISVVED